MSFSVRVRRSATISLDLRLLAQPVRRSLPAARASIRSPRSRRSVSMTKGRTIALCERVDCRLPCLSRSAASLSLGPHRARDWL